MRAAGVDAPSAPGERRALLAAAALRAFATGMAGVLLGLYLAELGLTARTIGWVTGAGLAGAAAGALAVTVLASRWPVRQALLTLGIVSAAGAFLLAGSSRPALLGLAAFFGMVNGMGRDRGPLYVLEQARLPALAPPSERTLAFAWYTALQDAGHALGSLAAGLPALLVSALALGSTTAWRLAFLVYALLWTASVLPYLRLSAPAEGASPEPRGPLSHESKRILVRIASLFALDGLGSGLLTTALLTYFFFERFGVSPGTIGVLFFVARLANVASHFAAAWLARRIGLVATMVLTHLPSSLLLIGAALAPSFAVAATFFLLREALVEMDVPTRQSYLMAVVGPHERVFASGLTNLVRLVAWALGPALAGLLMSTSTLAAPLLFGAALKIVYDVLLYRAFRHVRPAEEVPA